MTIPLISATNIPFPEDYDGVIVRRKVKCIPSYYGCARIKNYKRYDQPIPWFIYTSNGNHKFYVNSVVSQLGDGIPIEQFMDHLTENYPEDYEFILWHPEVLRGEYYGE